jgi:hypothetical protein
VATGASAVDHGVQEIGREALMPKMAEMLKHDLKANPPQSFNVARTLRIFSSKIQYVELEATNYRLSSRHVALPDELLDITDDELRKRISGRIQAPTSGLGKLKITVETPEGKQDEMEIDERWSIAERKRIEDRYTFAVPRYGRVILNTERLSFNKEVGRFERNLAAYHVAVVAAVKKVGGKFEESVVDEFLPRWKAHPPDNLTRYIPEPTDEDIEQYIRPIAQRLFKGAVEFAPPYVRIVYKNISPESVRDPNFLEALKVRMRRRKVPEAFIWSLFATCDAAPTVEGLTPNQL